MMSRGITVFWNTTARGCGYIGGVSSLGSTIFTVKKKKVAPMSWFFPKNKLVSPPVQSPAAPVTPPSSPKEATSSPSGGVGAGQSNAITAPATTNETVRGLDVSHYEPYVDWNQAREAGYTFAMAKATDGLGSIDAKFAAHRKNAEAAGFIFGGYHFLRYGGISAKDQAALFVKAIGPVVPSLIFCDVEWDNYTADNRYANGKEIDNAGADVALEYLREVERLTGTRPCVYTGKSFFTVHRPEFAEYPLWVFDYHSKDKPLLPSSWSTWAFWQQTDKRNVPGTGAIDASIFNGSLDQLKAMLHHG